MDVNEFKQTYPEMAHLKGDKLLDAMEDAFIHQKQGEQILNTIKPFYKRYKLRYLFYRKLKNSIFQKEWQSDTVCKNCKKGTSSMVLFMGKYLCIYCAHEMVKEPNRHIKYKLWLMAKKFSKIFWIVFQCIHLVRSDHSGRYELGGDEAAYVKVFHINMSTGKTTCTMHSRKWYEYIFIKK